MKNTIILSTLLAVTLILSAFTMDYSTAQKPDKEILTADVICVRYNGAFIEGAYVSIPALGINGYTGPDGCASISGNPNSGTYCVCASYKMNRRGTGSITFTTGQDGTTIDIYDNGPSCDCPNE